MGKIFDSGLLVGRFQTFHKGHQLLVETGLKLCDRMLILVGSSQESGTERNPYDVSTRIDMIREIYDTPNIEIHGIADMTNENDIRPEWGRYLLEHVNRYLHKTPEVMVYGNDESRSRWFDQDDIKDTMEIIVPRSTLPISATQIRKLMVDDNRNQWMQCVDQKLHKHYDKLRSELIEIEFYKKLRKENA